MRILFVENHDAFSTTVIEAFLSRHCVRVVPDVKSAKNAADTSDYDVILVDYDLDDGKGSEVVAHVRRSNRSVPIVAVSSHARGNDELLAAGVNECCPKSRFHEIGWVLENLRVCTRGAGHIVPSVARV